MGQDLTARVVARRPDAVCGWRSRTLKVGVFFSHGTGRAGRRTADGLLRRRYGRLTQHLARRANTCRLTGSLPGLMDAGGESIWTVIANSRSSRPSRRHARIRRWQRCRLRLSWIGRAVLRFDARSLTLSSPPPNDGLTFMPNREGLTIDGWLNGSSPALGVVRCHCTL